MKRLWITESGIIHHRKPRMDATEYVEAQQQPDAELNYSVVAKDLRIAELDAECDRLLKIITIKTREIAKYNSYNMDLKARIFDLEGALKAIVDMDEDNVITDENNGVGSWQSEKFCILLDNARKAIARAEKKGGLK